VQAQAAAQAPDVSPHTVRKWLACFRCEGMAELADRSSAPHRTPAGRVAAVEHLRCLRARQTQTAQVLRIVTRYGDSGPCVTG